MNAAAPEGTPPRRIKKMAGEYPEILTTFLPRRASERR